LRVATDLQRFRRVSHTFLDVGPSYSFQFVKNCHT